MGQFGNQPDFATNGIKEITTTNGFISDTPSSASFLGGSIIYIGDNLTVGNNLKVIPAGTVGVQGEIQTATVVDGGSGYATATDVPVINPESGLGTGAELDVTAVGGVITVAGGFGDPGSGYRQGDIVTVSGGDGNAKIRINVLNSLPTAAQAVTFKGLGTGGFLPVTVDYVLATGTTVAELIAAR
tara:strand:- start:375 stop:932 length:558 start_codon:yes stop_codon:yes gene_type:complete